MSIKTIYTPRIVSTAVKPTAKVNAFNEDMEVKAIVAEYGPIAAAKAAKDDAHAKLLAEARAKYGVKNAT
jgi:hypothetical protein